MNSKIIIGLVILCLIIVLCLFLIFFSNYGKLSFIIQYQNAKGLKTGDLVYVKGVEIGIIKAIKYENDIVRVKVIVNSYYRDKIPIDSKFSIKTDTFITGKKCIKVKFGKSNEMIENNDIIDGSSIFIKTWGNIKEKIDSVFDSNEWQDLNASVEKLLDNAYKQGKDEFKEIYNEINLKIEELYNKVKADAPEKAKEFKEKINKILDKYDKIQ